MISINNGHVKDHFNRAMIEANIEAFEPMLLNHGYAAEDIATLNRECVEEVSQQRQRDSELDAEQDPLCSIVDCG
jgi:hypothetical protein